MGTSKPRALTTRAYNAWTRRIAERRVRFPSHQAATSIRSRSPLLVSGSNAGPAGVAAADGSVVATPGSRRLPAPDDWFARMRWPSGPHSRPLVHELTDGDGSREAVFAGHCANTKAGLEPRSRRRPPIRQLRDSRRRQPLGRGDRRTETPAFRRRRVRAPARGGSDRSPRFHAARGLSAEIG